MSRIKGTAAILGLVASLVAPSLGWAQSNSSGSIAGIVRDASGAVLPGVTVEASSPALIEQTRTVVTDGGGRYNLVELRPGTYVVTFSLTGFSTVRREGVELSTGFTATLNADMSVGGVAETITVSGATSLIDTTNVRTQDVYSSERLSTLPTSKSLVAFASLTAGVVLQSGAGFALQDVGGNMGEANAALMIHNSRGGDSKQLFDGMTHMWALGLGGGVFKLIYPNPVAMEEVTLETSGIGADTETGGIQVNAVPKDGGNSFRGTVIGNYTSGGLQGENLDDELRARGVRELPNVKKIYDEDWGVGGPIKRDKLWFFAAQRQTQFDNYVVGNYFNATLHTLFYTPDFDRLAYEYTQRNDLSARFTWQASSKHKLTYLGAYQTNCGCYTFATQFSPEATFNYVGDPLYHNQITWTYPATSRLLIQAGLTISRQTGRADRPIDGTEHDIGVVDVGTGKIYGSFPGLGIVSPGVTKGPFQTSRFSASYVTGSHTFKAGFFTYHGHDDVYWTTNDIPGLGNVSYVFVNQKPLLVQYYASPITGQDYGGNIGLYGQDQWTVNRLTLNLGVRYDYLHQWVPAQTRPAGAFTPAISFDEIDVSTWQDFSPRLGAAFDLFGKGKTAVKASIGRYVIGDSTQMAANNNPARAISTTSSRTWSDNGDYYPQESELGPFSNAAFGTPVINTHYSDELLKGWYVRPYDWQLATTIQHELRPGMSVQVGYFRSWYGNFYATDNTLIGPQSFDPFCVTAPVDARLPGGGGNEICGYTNIDPEYFGKVNNVVTPAETFGKLTEIYNGVDAVFNSRFGKGGQLTAGFSTGQTTIDNCAVVDDPAGIQPAPANGIVPQRPRAWCQTTNPYKGQTQLKLNGSYPLPKDFSVAAVFQSLPGIPVSATYSVKSSDVPSLGRPLSSATNVSLIEPFTQFEPRLEQTDLRLAKLFRFGRVRLRAQADLYNVFNANNVLAMQGTYGPSWLLPQQVLAARLFKFGGQLDF